MIEALIALAAMAGGAVLAWLWRSSTAKAVLVSSEQRLEETTRALESLKADHARSLEMLRVESASRAGAEACAARLPGLEAALAERNDALARHQAKLAELETRIAEERKASEEKLAMLDRAQASLSDAFKALSSDALKNNNQSFIELAKATLEKFQEGAKGDLEARQRAVDDPAAGARSS